MALSKEDIFKTGPSPEEEKYNTAVELMDAIDCVERFERAVTSLRSAAAMFEELGDYEDARKRHISWRSCNNRISSLFLHPANILPDHKN